jgi:D-alanyl-D-alanine carboxypeptidase/D-alanyl-D-alanine carboxypeptidase (penicillin-binding protein 5/6)
VHYIPTAAQPFVSAKSAILIDAHSGSVLFSYNSYTRLPMASTTKIITAIIAISHADMDTVVTIPAAAVGVEGSSMYLFLGERVTMRTLLYALMMRSANDAATAIAIEIAGSVENFAMLMNYTAARLGLTNTNFTNPHGLDHEEHFTTAHDLAIITAYALQNSLFREVVSTKSLDVSLMDKEGSRFFHNHNRLLRTYDGALGVKTGFTRRSGRSLVSAAERDGMMLVAVTINAPNDWNDHRAMLDYGFSTYQNAPLALPGQFEFNLSIVGGSRDYVRAANVEAVHYFSRQGMSNFEDIRHTINLREMRFAPLRAGEVVGYVTFFDGDEKIAQVDIVALESAFVRVETSFWRKVFRR